MGSSNFLCSQRRALVCLTFLTTIFLCSFTINVTEGSVGQTRSGLSSTATPAATPPSECSSLLVLSRCPAHSFSTMSCPCLCGHRNHGHTQPFREETKGIFITLQEYIVITTSWRNSFQWSKMYTTSNYSILHFNSHIQFLWSCQNRTVYRRVFVPDVGPKYTQLT